MKNPIRRRLYSIVALVLGLSLLAVGLTCAAAEPGGSEKMVSRSVAKYPLTGVTLEVTKVLDPASGQAYSVAVDTQGKRRDVAQVEAEETKARFALYGKLNPRLHGKVSQMKEQDKIPVSIWLDVADPPLRRPQAEAAMTAEAARAALSSHLDRVQNHMAPKRQGVLETLAQMGVSARVPKYGPAVFADLTPGQIRKISQHPEVATLYGPEEYTLFSDDGSTTHRAYRVWQAGNLGFGTSSRPVVHEPDGVADYNPYLSNSKHPVIYWNSENKNIDYHATMVAGVIASTHPLYRGMAPNAQLILSANSQDWAAANLVDAAEWAIGNGGCPVNMSWGTLCGGDQTFESRYVDWATKNLWATFVISAGNMGVCGDAAEDPKVSSPGLAWSVITVGSQEDDNNGFWTGDSMSTWSRWVNPDFSTGMEKPEVVAVGEAVMTTDELGGDNLTPAPGVNGTSFSAPMVAGQVTQILARRPGLNIWPEVNKATVLASAFHDIDTGGRSKDGVGAVMMNISDDTARLGRSISDSDAGFPLGPEDFPRQKLDVLNLQAGQRVRVAIAWDSWSTGGAGPDVLGADLDLQIRNPSNAVIAGSYSVSNAWELVDFTAPVTGLYDVLVNRFSSVANWPGTFLGIAWSIYSKPNFTSGYANVPATGGAFSVNTANGGTYFDAYPGVGWNESGRERVYRLQLTTTKDITVTDNNGSLDLFVLQFPSASADPLVPTVKAAGINSASVDNAPAGVYWIVVDGFGGYVGSTSMTVSVSGP